MKHPEHKQTGKRRLFRRLFLKDDKGVAAIEFAFVAGPFFLILFSILEVALVYFGAANLEYATNEAARLIRTGQAQTGDFNRIPQPDPNDPTQTITPTGPVGVEEFKELICRNVFLIQNCKSKIKVEVKEYNDFTSMNVSSPVTIDPTTNQVVFDPSQVSAFDTVGSCKPAVVRAFIEWDLIAQVPGIGMGNLGNGNRLLTGASIFQTEPYGGGCP